MNSAKATLIQSVRLTFILGILLSFMNNFHLSQAQNEEKYIEGATWNHDETQVLTWSNDHTARVWDAQTGEVLLLFNHDASVNGATWNRDETQVLTWSDDYTVRLWDARTGNLVLRLAHKERVSGALWNETETYILTWAWNDTIQVWDVQSGTLLLSISDNSKGRTGWSHSQVGWSYDDKQIYILSSTRLQFWDIETGTSVMEFEGVVDVLFNSDRTKFLLTLRKEFQLVDTQSGKIAVVIPYDGEFVGIAIWNHAGTRFLTTVDSMAYLWDASTGELLNSTEAEITYGVWSSTDTQLLMLGEAMSIRVWDPQAGEFPLILPYLDYTTDITWNKDETRILVTSLGGAIRVWDTKKVSLLLEVFHRDTAIGALWNQAETQILTWSRDGTARIWDAQTGEQLQTFSHWDSN